MTLLQDAHNHLHDPRLEPHLESILKSLPELGVSRCVVNGTSEADWPKVAQLAENHPDLVQPSFGLHPWKVADRSARWMDTLQSFLDRFPSAGLGECGLDKWIRESSETFPQQREVFTFQLELAAGRNLPLSIHCLQAWGPLLEILRAHPCPKRGFLLHSYNGSAELTKELLPLGAYFSFSGHFLHPRKENVRKAFLEVPLDRLLVETDAPDMAPPPAPDHRFLGSSKPLLNHPANLPPIANKLASLRDLPPPKLNSILAQNFETFFGTI